MAALDPRFEVRFESGSPTAPNLNAAAGDLWLNVDAAHWLYVASGGDMPADPASPSRYRIRWTDLWMEFLKFTPVDTAMHSTLVVRMIGNLRFFHDGFQRAVGDGLDSSPRGSLGLALAAFVEFCTEKVQADKTPWVLNATNVQNLPAVPANHGALPAEVEYVVHLEVGMLRRATGSQQPPRRPPVSASWLGITPGQR